MFINVVVPSAAGVGATEIGAAVAFVVDLPPTPENSTLTVVAEAARAGPDFGAKRELRLFALLELAKRGGGTSERGWANNNFEIGAIQLWVPGFAGASISGIFSGYSACWLILQAIEGSRMISLRTLLT
jgi:hypothetical protein